MANEEQLALIKQGVEIWNRWREESGKGIQPDLKEASLREANLKEADLSGADLKGADLREADLRGTDLSGADLKEADLSGADLKGADFREADLRGANLRETMLDAATQIDQKWRLVQNIVTQGSANQNLKGVDLRIANLSGAVLNRVNFQEADLRGAGLSGADLREANLSGADLSDADLRFSNLSGAVLNGTILNGADFDGANLKGTMFNTATQIEQKWRLVQNIVTHGGRNRSLKGADLIGANLRGTDLKGADLRGASFWSADLSDADLRGADLRGAHLSGTLFNLATQIDQKWRLVRNILAHGGRNQSLRDTNLSDADLRGADLGDADLRGADLSRAELTMALALGADFTGATFTGACIQDWHTNADTKLDGVVCDYIYLKQDQQERRPSNPNQIFAPGEFTKLFQKAHETLDLIFRNGVDWKAFAFAFQHLQVENEAAELAIASIENKGDGVVVIRIRATPAADKPKLHGDLMQVYEVAHKALEAQYQARLEDKDKYINQLIEQVHYSQAQIVEVTKHMADAPKYDQRGSTFGNFADTVQAGGKQQNIQHIYASEHEQTLAEAAAEIQALLQQLEQTNPAATESDQKAFVNAAISPTRRERVLGAVQAGSIAFLEETPRGKIIKAIIEGWKKPG